MVLIIWDRTWSLDILRPAVIILCCNRAVTQPWRDGACFPPGMRKLDGNFLTLRMREFGDLLKAKFAFEVLVAPDSGIFRCDAPFR